jgi:methylphosphotriester-DNA--protein-cysteine methyltransferase
MTLLSGSQTCFAMFYQKIKPSVVLRPFVECFYIWEHSANPLQTLLVESPPSGYASMVFNYGDIYQVYNSKYKNISVPRAFITGQSSKSYQLHLKGQVGMVGIVFKPAGISSLFKLPMYEFVDERINLEDVTGKPACCLSEQIQEASSPAERIRLLEHFLLSQLSRQSLTYDRIDYAANQIIHKQGIIQVSGLIEEVFLCQRQFERKFLYKVGVSAKYYARIRRISFLCASLAANRWQIKDWHDFIHTAGYYDQAHFIKDFNEFTGKSPAVYVKNNVELTNFLNTLS